MAGYNPYQTNSYQATQFFPQPAYITCSPYQSVNGTCGSNYNCGCCV